MSGRNVSMQFGRNGGVVQNRSGWKFIGGGEITDDTTEDLSFTAGGLYVLVVKVWTESSGAYRGHCMYFIAAPEDAVFGTVAIARVAFASGGTISLTLTNNSDSTLSIVRSNSAYSWRYALYRIDGQGSGSAQSEVEPYTGSYSVTPTENSQSLSTAGKRMIANLEVEQIPTDFGQVSQSGDTLSIS